jgi:hypothetical protein
MIVEVKEIYKCEHCRKIYQNKRFAILHEEMCKKNPENKRACFGCKNLSKKEKVLYYDHPMGGEITRTFELCHCSKKDCFVYPPEVEHKGSALDLGDEFNEPMPKQCEFYIEQDYDF